MKKKRLKGTYLLGPRRDEGCRTAPSLGAKAAAPPGGSSHGLRQVADADQVVHRQAEDEYPAHSRLAAVPRLAQHPDGLQPAEDLFHALALPLAHLVPG